MLLETSLANAVIDQMQQCNGIYLPPVLKKEIMPFYAAGNTDFSEDTPDGTGTLHGTIIIAYQEDKDGIPVLPVAQPLNVDSKQIFYIKSMSTGNGRL